MRPRHQIISSLAKALGPREARRILLSSEQQESLEAKWRRRLQLMFDQMTDLVISELLLTGKIDESKLPFADFFFEQSVDVMRHAIKSSGERMPPVTRGDSKKLAAPPKGKIPTSLRELMNLWDYYRKKGDVPPRQKAIAAKVQKAYVKKIQSVWDKHSKSFREGSVYTQEEVVRRIRKASGSQFARSKMIVETENTRYYNGVRQEIYGQSPDVSHFLFVAIRDAATTKWCRTRTGLVFSKETELFKRNAPPCHWNCRSEILPLSPLNPRHLRLIQNPALRAENNRLYPLPKGWNRAVG